MTSNGQFLAATSARYHGMQLIAETDGNGIETLYEYDGAGRQIAVEKGDTRTEFEYDPLGRKTLIREWIDNHKTQAKITRTLYDPIGRVSREQIEDNLGHIYKWVCYTYDSAGNPTTKTEETQAGLATTTTLYDTLNRPIRIIDPMGHATVIEYDDTLTNHLGQRLQLIRTTDPLGTQKWVTTDTLGRCIEEITKNPLGQIVSLHQLGYDGVGQVVCRRDFVYIDQAQTRQMVTRWTYDPMNRPLAIHEAIGTSEERSTYHTYNCFGQQDSFIAADGTELRFEYDPLGRLATYRASDNTFHYTYQYDSVGNLLDSDDQIQGDRTHRNYDPCGRLLSETLANGLTVDYRYDALGRPLVITLPDGSGSRYSYDALYLRTVSRLDPQGNELYSHQYTQHDPKGNILAATHIGHTGTSQYSYDLLSRPMQQSSPGYVEHIGPEGYDPVGNLVARKVDDAQGMASCRYSYDDLYQLASESGFTQHQYKHDSLNNRLKKDDIPYTLNALNQLLEEGDNSYRYDRRGNLIAKDTHQGRTSYQHDALGRLTQVNLSDSTIRFQYDSFNRRISKTIQKKGAHSESTKYLYLGQNEVGAVDDCDRLFQFRLLGCGKGAEIGATVAIETSAGIFAAVSDSAGNIVRLIEATQNRLSESYRYTAFGEQECVGKQPLNNPWGFASKRYDPETGLIYFGRRYYDPLVGRWVTPDPIGYVAGPNLYAYVMNNPLTHFDLYGLMDNGTTAKSRRERANAHAAERRASRGERPIVQHLSWVATLPGRIIETVGRHFVLIPLVRDVVMAIGRFAQGRSFWGCEHCLDRHSYNGATEGRELADRYRHTAVNGILNSRDEGLEFFNALSYAKGGQKMHHTYSATTGAPIDLLECVALFFGFQTKASREQARNWKDCLAEMDALGFTDGVILHDAHSQGGLVTWRAKDLMKPKELERIYVVTYGSAKLIPDEGFGGVRNVVSKRDPIPIVLNPIAYFKARLFGSSNIHFIDPAPGSGLIDHSWRNPTYYEDIKENGLRYQNIISKEGT